MSRAGVLMTRAQAFALAEAIAVSATVACGDGMDVELRGTAVISDGPADAGHAQPPGSGFLTPADRERPCSGLACQIEACEGRPKTSISGTVYDPAGKVPLYNVVVYVPGAELDEIPTGVACQTCDGYFSGRPIAVALSGADGSFHLEDAPAGQNIPLVMQVGKWRRQINVPSVPACTDTPITDRDLTRLPRDQSEGHIPKIAIATGGSDALECLVRKIGISDSEFTTESGPGRVNLFAGYNAADTLEDGTPLTTTDELWSDAGLLNGYDMMLLSCEGDDNLTRTETQYANVRGFADAGGRIFGSHWHHGWINPDNQPYPEIVDFASSAHGFEPPEIPITVSIDTTFPKGQAFAEWLASDAVVASTMPGLIDVRGAEHSVDAVDDAIAQRWIYGTDMENGNPMVQYFSFNTPVGQPECGRMVFSDLHVSAGPGTDSGKVPFPTGCVTEDLSPQEKALEFMIFDLSSCVQPDAAPVEPPPVIL